MVKKKLYLVCEGPTDIKILDAISKSLKNVNGYPVDIIPLAPQLDATSNRYPSHGWTKVQSWCISSKTKTEDEVSSLDPKLQQLALRKNWRNILSAMSADGIIIQIDTDIAGYIRDCPLGTFNNQNSVKRKNFVKSAILNWLSEHQTPQEIYLVLSSYSTETWIMACHDSKHPMFQGLPIGFNYEDVDDVEFRLITNGYKSKNNGTKLDKNLLLYDRYAQLIVSSLDDVRSRCAAADDFCTFIESL